MRYTDRQRLERIQATAAQLSQYLAAEQITPERVMSDYTVQWAVTTPLYNIGEHVSQLSPEFKAMYPLIPWAKIAGLRHRLVHNYEGTNWGIICQVLFHDLPDFVAALPK